MNRLLPLIAFAMLAACAPLYTPGTQWTSDQPDETFRPDLTACVQQFDPAHLPDMDNDGEYQPTGIAIDTARTQAVVSCMEAKGWDAEGPEWYQGPVR